MTNIFTLLSLKSKVYVSAYTNRKIPMPLILTKLPIEKLALHFFNSCHVLKFRFALGLSKLKQSCLMTSSAWSHDFSCKQFLARKLTTNRVMNMLCYLSFFVVKGYHLEIIKNVIKFI